VNSVRHYGSTNGNTGEIEQSCKRGDGDSRFRTDVGQFSAKLHGVAYRKTVMLPYTTCQLQISYSLLSYSFKVTEVYRTKIQFLSPPTSLSSPPIFHSLSHCRWLSTVISSAKDREIYRVFYEE